MGTGFPAVLRPMPSCPMPRPGARDTRAHVETGRIHPGGHCPRGNSAQGPRRFPGSPAHSQSPAGLGLGMKATVSAPRGQATLRKTQGGGFWSKLGHRAAPHVVAEPDITLGTPAPRAKASLQ